MNKTNPQLEQAEQRARRAEQRVAELEMQLANAEMANRRLRSEFCDAVGYEPRS